MLFTKLRHHSTHLSTRILMPQGILPACFGSVIPRTTLGNKLWILKPYQKIPKSVTVNPVSLYCIVNLFLCKTFTLFYEEITSLARILNKGCFCVVYNER